MSSLSKKKEFFFLALAFLFLNTFIRYNGNYTSFYNDVWQFHSENFDYLYDIYFQNSIAFKSQVIYKLFNSLKINIDNDLIGFLFHLICSSIGLVFTFKIAQEFLGKKEIYKALAVTLSLSVYVGILHQAADSGWSSSHTATPTLLAKALIFPLIWFALKKNWFFVGITSAIMMFTSLKYAWFPIGVCILFAVISKDKRLLRLGWIAIPIIAAIFLFFANIDTNISSFRIKQELWNNLVSHDQIETFFHLHNKWRFLAFLFSFFLFWLLIQKLQKNSSQKKMALIILFTSMPLAILGWLYGLFGKSFFPEPQLMILSPVRAMDLYQFFFGMLISITLVNLRIPIITVAGFLASFFYYYYALSLLPILLLGSYIIQWMPFSTQKLLYSHLNFKETLLPAHKKAPVNSGKLILRYLFIIILPILIINFASKVKNLDWEGYKYIGQFQSGFSDEENLFKSALILRKCKDFILLPISRNVKKNNGFPAFNNGPFPYVKLNFVAGKSKYYGDKAHFYLDHKNLLIHKKRELIVKSLILSMQNKTPLSSNIIEELSKNSIKILTYKKWTDIFPSNIIRHNLIGDVELVEFGKTGEFKCIKDYKKNGIIKKIYF